MSLDVYLTTEDVQKEIPMPKIFVRENGQIKEISREEWDQKFPNKEPITIEQQESNEVYSANITHNLGKMADEAGIYKHLWRPEEIGITKANQLIEPLRVGLSLLRTDPDYFRAFSPPNGWGDYEGFVDFVSKYLAACIEYPDAVVGVSR